MQIFLHIDRYYIILQYLLQNFIYLHWMGIAISAKEGTSAKDRTYPVPIELSEGALLSTKTVLMIKAKGKPASVKEKLFIMKRVEERPEDRRECPR